MTRAFIVERHLGSIAAKQEALAGVDAGFQLSVPWHVFTKRSSVTILGPKA